MATAAEYSRYRLNWGGAVIQLTSSIRRESVNNAKSFAATCPFDYFQVSAALLLPFDRVLQQKVFVPNIVRVVTFTSINAVVLFFASMLAAGGDGDASGVKAIWLLGYTWIALVCVAAFVLCTRNRGALGTLLTIAALPILFLMSIVVVIGGRLMGFSIG